MRAHSDAKIYMEHKDSSSYEVGSERMRRISKGETPDDWIGTNWRRRNIVSATQKEI